MEQYAKMALDIIMLGPVDEKLRDMPVRNLAFLTRTNYEEFKLRALIEVVKTLAPYCKEGLWEGGIKREGSVHFPTCRAYLNWPNFPSDLDLSIIKAIDLIDSANNDF